MAKRRQAQGESDNAVSTADQLAESLKALLWHRSSVDDGDLNHDFSTHQSGYLQDVFTMKQ